MEENKKRSEFEANDKEIVYSQSVKAGKRIYYLDVKKNRKDEMFLAITESKKIVTGEGDIEGEQGHPTHSHEKKPAAQADSPAKKEEETPLGGDEIKIDIDF